MLRGSVRSYFVLLLCKTNLLSNRFTFNYTTVWSINELHRLAAPSKTVCSWPGREPRPIMNHTRLLTLTYSVELHCPIVFETAELDWKLSEQLPLSFQPIDSNRNREITSWNLRAYDFYSRVEKYQKMNEWAQRTSKFSDTHERMKKYRTSHFRCYFFILLVLRFVCNFFLNGSWEKIVKRNANDKISSVKFRNSRA